MEVAQVDREHLDTKYPNGLSLEEVISEIERELEAEDGTAFDKRENLRDILAAYNADLEEWRRYAFFDEHKYTRNLISTDYEKYTLLLLCWNKNQYSPVHDHPCDGCWMRVVSGCVREVQYLLPDGSTPHLIEKKTTDLGEGGVCFIHDSIALHKVGNPDYENIAATIHLYCPPFDSCRVWTNPEDANRVLHPVVTFYSENGEKIQHT